MKLLDSCHSLFLFLDFDDSMFVKTSTQEQWIAQGEYYAKHQCWKVNQRSCHKTVWGWEEFSLLCCDRSFISGFEFGHFIKMFLGRLSFLFLGKA